MKQEGVSRLSIPIRTINSRYVLLGLLQVALYSSGSEANLIWSRRYATSGNATKVAVDQSRNIYLGGTVGTGASTYDDFVLIKYDANGNPLWTNRFDGGRTGGTALDKSDRLRAMALDSSGNVIMAGDCGSDLAVVKYTPAGSPVWTNRYHGVGGSTDSVNALAVDDSDNVVITGYTYAGSAPDYLTIKYASNGMPLWTNFFDNPPDTYDAAKAVAVDKSGNVYVTGLSDGGAGKYYDYVTIKYTGAGVPVWTNRYNGSGSWRDIPTCIGVDTNENVYVTGYSRIGTSDKWVTVQYRPDGTQKNVRTYFGPGNGWDTPRAMHVTSDGIVYITGDSSSVESSSDMTTIKYDALGNAAWVRRFSGPGSSWDVGWFLTLDVAGNVYVTGTALESATGQDIVTIKYNSDGLALWTNRFDGPRNSDDEGNSLALFSPGELVVAGDIYRTGTSFEMAVFRLSESQFPPDGAARSLTLSPTDVTVKFVGVPWLNYTVERSTSVLPSAWTPVATNTAPANGEFEYIDLNPPGAAGFYRSRRN